MKTPEYHAESPSGPTHIVGIGASAGGLIALEELFKTIPLKTGLAFVVIQHLPADHKSMMVELLSRDTDLPICYVEESMTAEPDSVYLIPPGYNIRIFHNQFLLSKPEENKRQINLPIDIFLSSLAEDKEAKAIAVILSGTGSDGSRGIRHIKEKFGITIAQDPASAQFDGMPKSAIETGIVDFILPPEEMISHILSCIQHPFAQKITAQPQILADETGLTRIFSMLRENHLVDFTFYKQATVLRRIERRMTINQMNELQDYIRFLESYPNEITTLYNELLIGVTNFFRDPEAFEWIGKNILLEWFRTADKNELRIWVEGCSTGEEAYTLAILCQDIMETLGKKIRVKIFAADVDKRAILAASDGCYHENITADLTSRQLAKYFYRKGTDFQISRQIREMVVFAQHNILKDPPFTKIDIVTCRNMLIYLQPVLQKKALEKFNFALNPGGILFLGSSESIGEMNYYFDSLNHKWKIYRSKGKRSPVLGIPDRYVPERYPSKPIFTRHREPRTFVHERLQERLLEALAKKYVSLILLVSEENEILYVLGDTEKFLKFPSGKPINDLSRVLTKEMLVPVMAGLQKVFKDRTAVKYSSIQVHHKEALVTARMEIHPVFQKANEPVLAAILLEDAKENPVPEEGPIQEIDVHIEKRIENLENELQFTRESLQTTIEELETSNEELGATNEELMASNEELQSTNEELQSVNEELYTVNAEYQGKNFELVDIKNDLENLFINLQIPILFLDENLAIRQFTPQIAELFKITDKDFGRPIGHIAHSINNEDLIRIFQHVMETGVGIEKEMCTNAHEWYLVKIHPYKISKQFFSGVVVVFITITQRKISELRLQRFAAVVRDSNDAVTVHDFDGTITAWNLGAQKIYGFSEAEALKMNIRDLVPEKIKDTALDYIKLIRRGDAVTRFKTQRRTRNGDVLDIFLTVTQLMDETGTAVAVATTERNISGLPEDCV